MLLFTTQIEYTKKTPNDILGTNKTKVEMISQNDCHLSFQIKERWKIHGETKEAQRKRKNKKTSYAWTVH